MTNTRQAQIANEVVRLRRAQGLTQDDLIRRTGLSRATIQDVEREEWLTEKRPNNLRKIAEALGVTLGDLESRGVDTPPPTKRDPTPAEVAEFQEFLRDAAADRGITITELLSELRAQRAADRSRSDESGKRSRNP